MALKIWGVADGPVEPSLDKNGPELHKRENSPYNTLLRLIITPWWYNNNFLLKYPKLCNIFAKSISIDADKFTPTLSERTRESI